MGLAGHCHLWNRGAEALYGFTADEALGHMLPGLLQTTPGTLWPELQAALLATQRWHGELRHTTRAGQPILVESRQTLIAASDGQYSVLQCDRDMATRIQSVALLGAVLDALPVGVLIADADGGVLHANAAHSALWGIWPHTANWREYNQWVGYWPDTNRRIEAHEWAMSRALNMGEIITGELVVCEQFHTGQQRVFLNNAAPVRDANGAIVAGVVAELDVTDAQRAEAVLHHRSKQLLRLAQLATTINAAQPLLALMQQIVDEARALLDASWAGVSLRTDHDGAQTMVAVTLAGAYPATYGDALTAVGLGVAAAWGGRTQPLRYTASDLAAAPHWQAATREMAIVPGSWLVVPLHTHNDQVLGLIQLAVPGDESTFAADDEAVLIQLARLTTSALENQQLYAQEQAARAQAEAASRMKDDVLATVSHELRTPLTAFLGYAQLLQTRKYDDVGRARILEHMVRSAEAQARLIDDLVDGARMASGTLRLDLQLIMFSSVIQAALDIVRPAIEAKQQQLSVEIDPAADLIYGDALRLQQVVWNLLTNATKFTPTAGLIAVRLERFDHQIALSVRDSGAGISPAFLPHVFERFRQADTTATRAQQGLGLGLSIVRHIIELHGGQVEVQSDGPDQGSLFIIRMPLMRR
ncbi:PAS domain-containing protein [Candidatus Gracilibacteria bacterium]|nr:PAS domain-containing protein [Candidatus Gracilibacteria bacterium]